MRGTFANVRIKNLMVAAARRRRRDAFTSPTASRCRIYDAAMKYIADGTPTVVFAGEEYGTGSLARLGGEGHAAPRRARR